MGVGVRGAGVGRALCVHLHFIPSDRMHNSSLPRGVGMLDGTVSPCVSGKNCTCVSCASLESSGRDPEMSHFEVRHASWRVRQHQNRVKPPLFQVRRVSI